MNHSADVLRHIYTSATQKGYDDVNWDAKLSRRFKPPQPTLERSADPVRELSFAKRYKSRAQDWQSLRGEWDKRQLRSRHDAKKPVSFCSGYRRSGQIPLYTGTIGSENKDNIDNMDEDFHPLTLKRSIIPPYTPTAHKTTIPGYTGKARYANSANAMASSRITAKPDCVSAHVGPLSRMVTTVTPCNPFRRLPTLQAHTRRNFKLHR